MSDNKESDIVGSKVKAMIIEEALKKCDVPYNPNIHSDEFRDGCASVYDSIMQYAEELKNRNAG